MPVAGGRTNLQPEAKALASPTRYRIFRYIAESARPVTVGELTSYLGFNHNAIRQHLAVLVDAGLITGTVEPARGRGRPRLLYRLDPETAGFWETAGPYQYLASLLASAAQDGLNPREAGQAAGRKAARLVDVDGNLDPAGGIESQLQQRGFRPERIEKGSRVDFVLGHCPFAAVAADHPGSVCQLHLGLLEGLAENVTGLEVVRLVNKNPHRAGCRVVLRQRPRNPRRG
jgi:predicted ArsR family transcriptional regulator